MMKRKWKDRRFLLALLCAVLAGIGVAAGVTFSWFVAGKQLSSVAKIQKPAELKILNPDETQMTKIDLSYTDEDKTVDENGTTITIRRPILIESGSKNYTLSLAHTTNIDGMKIQLFRAKVEKDADNSVIQYPNGLSMIYWQYANTADQTAPTDIFAQGKYLNQEESGKIVAERKSKNDPNTFTSEEKNASWEQGSGEHMIQINAWPLYWEKEESGETAGEGVTIGSSGDSSGDSVVYQFRYILQLSWTETDKETDIFYLIAKNNAQNTSSAGDP